MQRLWKAILAAAIFAAPVQAHAEEEGLAAFYGTIRIFDSTNYFGLGTGTINNVQAIVRYDFDPSLSQPTSDAGFGVENGVFSNQVFTGTVIINNRSRSMVMDYEPVMMLGDHANYFDIVGADLSLWELTNKSDVRDDEVLRSMWEDPSGASFGSDIDFYSVFDSKGAGAGIIDFGFGDVFGYGPVSRFTLNVPIAAVPEPATWLSMILGFGLVGAALRRGNLRAAPRSPASHSPT